MLFSTHAAGKILAAILAGAACLPAIASSPPPRPAQAPAFELTDQYGRAHRIAFPRGKVSVITLADRRGSRQIEDWVRPLYERYTDRIEFHGIARVAGVPDALRPLVSRLFRRGSGHAVMLDWTGDVCDRYVCEAERANVLVVDRLGRVVHRVHGTADRAALERCFAEIDRLLKAQADPPAAATGA